MHRSMHCSVLLYHTVVYSALYLITFKWSRNKRSQDSSQRPMTDSRWEWPERRLKFLVGFSFGWCTDATISSALLCWCVALNFPILRLYLYLNFCICIWTYVLVFELMYLYLDFCIWTWFFCNSMHLSALAHPLGKEQLCTLLVYFVF